MCAGAFEQRVAGCGIRLGVEREQCAVVVEHFFEVRDHPAIIHGVAAEAAAKLIIDAALSHLFQREYGHVQGAPVAHAVMVAGAGPVAQQAFQVGRVRKLRCLAETAVAFIETLLELPAGGIERHRVEADRRALVAADRSQCPQQGDVLVVNFARVFGKKTGDVLHQFPEGRHAVPGLVREIGAGEERHPVIRRQEHGQRPAAGPAGQQGVGGLVDPVDVRALFPVDLDVDEEPVHEVGGVRILEGFVRHDVAPVTGRVTHREQDGLVFVARLLQRFGSPGIPVHRIVRVLQQVGTGLVDELVGIVAVLAHGHGKCRSTGIVR